MSKDKIEVSASSLNGTKQARGCKGGDPEVMLVRKGVIISSTDVLKPEREVAIPNMTATTIFSDGFQAEINFERQACRETIINLIACGLEGFRQRGCGVKICPIVSVDPEWLRTSPMSVRVSGCKPDFDAYRDGGQNPPVQDFDTLPIRFAGGHVAVDCGTGSCGGMMLKEWKDVCRFIKLMDRIVGIFSILKANSKGERVRRQYYGRPGCFRYHKDKYVEYRSMSNWWMASPVYTWIVYGLVDLAVTIYYSGLADLYLTGITDEEVIETMMTCDKAKAEKLVARMLQSLCRISRYIPGGPLNPDENAIGYMPNHHATLAALRDMEPDKDVFAEWNAGAYDRTNYGGWRKDLGLDGVAIEWEGFSTMLRSIYGDYPNGLKTYLTSCGHGSRSIIVSAIKNKKLVDQLVAG